VIAGAATLDRISDVKVSSVVLPLATAVSDASGKVHG
jgi:hypothetical protein